MENQENILKKLFECKKEEVEDICCKRNKKNSNELMNDIYLIIKYKMKNDKLQEKLLSKINEYNKYLIEEMDFNEFQFYKFGFKDAIKLKSEIE